MTICAVPLTPRNARAFGNPGCVPSKMAVISENAGAVPMSTNWPPPDVKAPAFKGPSYNENGAPMAVPEMSIVSVPGVDTVATVGQGGPLDPLKVIDACAWLGC